MKYTKVIKVLLLIISFVLCCSCTSAPKENALSITVDEFIDNMNNEISKEISNSIKITGYDELIKGDFECSSNVPSWFQISGECTDDKRIKSINMEVNRLDNDKLNYAASGLFLRCLFISLFSEEILNEFLSENMDDLTGKISVPEGTCYVKFATNMNTKQEKYEINLLSE